MAEKIQQAKKAGSREDRQTNFTGFQLESPSIPNILRLFDVIKMDSNFFSVHRKHIWSGLMAAFKTATAVRK